MLGRWLGWVTSMLPADSRPVVRDERGGSVEYIDIHELVRRTPWTADAVRRMIRRGVLRRGVHCFQPGGARGKLYFQWTSIDELIKAGFHGEVREGRCKVDVRRIREEAQALLG